MLKSGRRQLNKDAGFSLVELLIAVTILAIIAIPMLRLFVTSTRINVRSRQTLRATTVAQDIMEGLKAYNIEELQTQFNKPEEGFYVIDDRLIKGHIREETALEVDSAGDPLEGLYCFSMSGVNLQGSEYDALIRVDATGYMPDGGDPTKGVSHDNPFNSAGFARIGGVTESKTGAGGDGVFAEKADFREQSILKMGDLLKDELNANGIAQTDITYKTAGLELDRTYVIDIADSGSVDKDGNKIIDVIASVKFDQYSYGTVSGDNFYVLDHVPCASFTSGNLYFFYYPLYDAHDEAIEIHNPDHIPMCISIVKQIDSTTSAKMTDAQLTAAENNYHVEVDFTGFNKDDLRIRTNLGRSLVDSSYLAAEGKDKELPGQVKFKLNGTVRTDLNVFDLSGVRSTSLGTAGTDDEITELIYDVEVVVYKKGAAGRGFPEEDRMVTIGGSTNN